ncbi:MAG: hypothetical protein LBL35_04865 [Clostridiales bacterium]|nr:hypothetical protein [Clostridiales bacterium]
MAYDMSADVKARSLDHLRKDRPWACNGRQLMIFAYIILTGKRVDEI